MRRTILTLSLAAVALLFAADTASAQYPIQSTSFNPWVRYPNYQVTSYSPFGGLRTQNYAMSPWTGTQVYQTNYFNPRTGWGGNYTYGYNPWVNQYRYQYNTFNNRFASPTFVNPAYGYPFGW